MNSVYICLYICLTSHNGSPNASMESTPKVGYIARKRKQQHATSEQNTDEYCMWLISSGLVSETAVAMNRVFSKACNVQKNKETCKLMNSMQTLLTANPILARELALGYQDEMKQTYDKLFRQATTVKKKHKT